MVVIPIQETIVITDREDKIAVFEADAATALYVEAGNNGIISSGIPVVAGAFNFGFRIDFKMTVVNETHIG